MEWITIVWNDVRADLSRTPGSVLVHQNFVAKLMFAWAP